MAVKDNYLTTWQSELRLIAGVAAEWGNLETGGDLYGLQTHAGRAVIMLALPPGPKAVHKAAHFAQDPEHCRRLVGLLTECYALQLLGTYHHHHILGIPEPSSGDVRQVRSITGKNGIERWVEIITTWEDSPLGGRSIWPFCPPIPRFRSSIASERNSRVQINSFFYTNAPEGEKGRCPVRVIPGISPIRQALLVAGVLTEAELGFQGWTYPMARILFDKYHPEAFASSASSDAAAELAAQIARLPQSVRSAVRILPQPPLFGVFLPIRGDLEARLVLGRADTNTWEVRAVRLADPTTEHTRDITASLPGGSDGFILEQVYRRVADQVRELAPERGRRRSVMSAAIDRFAGRVDPEDGDQEAKNQRKTEQESSHGMES